MPTRLDQKIHQEFPSLQQTAAWALFLSAVTSLSLVPCFISFPRYANVAVETIFSSHDAGEQTSSTLLDTSITVPVVLSLNAAQQLAVIAQGSYASFLDNPRDFTKMPSLLTVAALLLAAVASLASSFSTAYINAKALKGHVSAMYLEWCINATFLVVTVTNLYLVTDLLALGKSKNTTLEQTSIALLLRDYQAYFPKWSQEVLANASPDSGNQSLLSNMSELTSQQLVEHFVAVRDTDTFKNLVALQLEQWPLFYRNNTDFLAQVNDTMSCQSRARSALFVGLAAIFALPNLQGGLSAEAFAAERGIAFPGLMIGGSSLAINTLINYHGLHALYDTMANFIKASNDGDRLPLTKVQWACNILEAVLVGFYVAAQLGMAKSFPSHLDGLSDKAVLYVQLTVAFFVATGLAKFSLGGAFDKTLAWVGALWMKDRLADKSIEKIVNQKPTISQILVMLNHCQQKLTKVEAHLKSLSPEDSETLFNSLVSPSGSDAEQGAPNSSIAVALTTLKEQLGGRSTALCWPSNRQGFESVVARES